MRWLIDAALALGIFAMQLFGTYMAARGQSEDFTPFAMALLTVGAAALVVRRRYPVAVFLVAFGTTFLYQWLEYPDGPIWGALVVAFFTLQLAGPRWLGWASLVAGFTSVWWLPGPPPPPLEIVAFAAFMLILVAVTEAVRVWRAYDAEQTQRRRSEQRLAIARDLHDVLAHNLSLINVQASTALHLFETRPEHAKPALEAVKQASGEALRELRGVLETLRHGDDRHPAPSLARLDELAAQAAAAGLEIDSRIQGEPRALPATVELAAYRICQEALTNVIRHAHADKADVRVAYGDADLTVEVTDDGRGGEPKTGNGLTGMRERTAAVGGTLQAGPRPEGGFRVRATLPVR